MEYQLKNGKTVNIRAVEVNDAEAIVNIIKTADTESMYLARNPGEFKVSVEQEETYIKNIIKDNATQWFVAEYDGKVVGQCSVGLVRRTARFRHRAEVTLVILKSYWDLGIGGKLMQECIKWCKENHVTQLELDVVKGNDRAIKMYQGFGFDITGTIPKALRYEDETYADEYKMVLSLC